MGATASIADNKLIVACLESDTALLTKFLSPYSGSSRNVNRFRRFRDNQGNNALMTAIKNDNRACILLALSKGIDLDSRNNDGYTPLMLAAHLDRVVALSTLVAQPKINTEACGGQDDRTALITAAWSDSIDVMKVLLQSGAKINHFDREHRTALMISAMTGHHRSVALLLTFAGIDTEVKDTSYERTALMLAAAHDCFDCIPILVNHRANLSIGDKLGYTALHCAVLGADDTCTGNPNSISKLLDVGAPIEARDNDGRTPLILAASRKRCDSLEALLGSHPAPDVEARDNQGNTALIHAASLSDGAAMVEMLLHNNASIDGANNYGCTPLIAAARSNSIECLSILLGRGADVIAKCNERGRDKDALLMAATYGHFECLRKLCAMDTVDIKVVDEEGYSCLMLALLSDNPKQTVQVILDAMTSLEDKIGIEMLRCQNKDGETAASMAKALDIRIVKRREEDAEQAIASAQAIRSAQLAAREVDYFVRSKFFEDPAYTPPDLSPEVKQSTEEAVNSSYFAALIAAKDEAFMRQQVLNRTKLEVELATEKAAEDRFRLKTKLRRVAKAVGKKGFRALAGGVSDLIHHNNKGT